MNILRCLFSLAIVVAATSVQAGNISERRIIGFSLDESVFAFEEFGVQDGSGFPYANIYVIDTNTDSWLPGSPIRVRIDDEAALLSDARRQARQQAGDAFGDYGLQDQWLSLASSPLGEFETSPTRLAFGVPMPADARAELTGRYEAKIDIFDAEAPGQDCETYIGAKPKGFRLTLRNLTSNTETVLHADSQVPRSRGCPITYRISEIVVPDSYPARTVAVLVSVIVPGFEGADRKFLAVTGKLPQ